MKKVPETRQLIVRQSRSSHRLQFQL